MDLLTKQLNEQNYLFFLWVMTTHVYFQTLSTKIKKKTNNNDKPSTYTYTLIGSNSHTFGAHLGLNPQGIYATIGYVTPEAQTLPLNRTRNHPPDLYSPLVDDTFKFPMHIKEIAISNLSLSLSQLKILNLLLDSLNHFHSKKQVPRHISQSKNKIPLPII